MRALFALILTLAPILAQAQATAAITTDQMERFRTCRAALFYHLDGDLPRDSRLPRAYAEALLEQMTFIMAETIRNAPHASVEQSRAAMEFTERFFLGFSRTIAERADLKTNLAAREKLLVDCQPLIWDALHARIDVLLARREGMNYPLAPAGP
ncbi:MAG: hypothetical protein CVT86_02630 [Alphaproteobacteria bacterium HGW-Alphaproteobacteria-8]|nr:MAG: hypothetical protein CVT86_02630 [Alphaproteobacteria bacterium HGW-Alphaproteobacteria-8]